MIEQKQCLYLEVVDEYGEIVIKSFDDVIMYHSSMGFFQIHLNNGETYGFRTDNVFTYKTYFVNK